LFPRENSKYLTTVSGSFCDNIFALKHRRRRRRRRNNNIAGVGVTTPWRRHGSSAAAGVVAASAADRGCARRPAVRLTTAAAVVASPLTPSAQSDAQPVASRRQPSPFARNQVTYKGNNT